MSLNFQSAAAPYDAAAESGVSLDELFPQCAGDNLTACFATSCTSDVRQIQQGDVFVAIDDGQSDGHELAREAVARGAVAVVCERAVPVFNVPTYVVDDTRIALGQLCQALVGYPAESMRIVAVAGTHGKSTTIALLESIFNAADMEVGVLSSFKSYDGMSRAAGIGDGPAPAFLASRLARMDAAGCSHALVEVSTTALAQQRLAGIDLDAVCMTHVTAADLDVNHSPENYRQTTRRVLDQLGADGVAVLNADDPVCCRWTGDHPGPVLTYGCGGAAEISANIIETNACEQTFLLSIGEEAVAVRTNIIGEHHVQNCLAAAATAFAYGVSLECIARGIESVAKIPARMQRVDRGQDFPIFVDAARTPQALRSTLRTARQLSAGRVICVLGDQASRDANENKAVELVTQKLADVVIVTDALAATTMWKEQIESESTTQIVADRKEAIEWAVTTAERGDVVVIAGSPCGPTVAFGSQAATDAELVGEMLLTCEPPQALRLVA